MMKQSDPYKEPSPREWRAFWTLVAVQAQNAFNEKSVQFLLIPLGVWLWGTDGSNLEYILGAIFVLPYILFSPLVGWLADCFSKTRIIQVMSFIQCVVMACMLFCFYMRDMQAAIVWFAIFATQATILSPAKKGIVKDLLGSKYIGFGSGIIEMSLVFVLLAAQVSIFLWYGHLLVGYSDVPDAISNAGWYAAILPTWILLGLAMLVAVLSLFLPRYPSMQERKFSISLFYEHFGQIKYLWQDRKLRLSELGIAYFWCLAGSLFLIIIQIAKGINVGQPDADFSFTCAMLMSWLTGGVIFGGVIASRLCLNKNELGLIPLGAIGMTISTLLLSICDVNTFPSNLALALTGAFGAAYLVPLNAYLQDNCDPKKRGTIIAAGNLIDNLMGLVAVALMWFMHSVGCTPQMQFLVLFLMSLFIMITSLRLIPQDFIRMIGLWLMHFIYRDRIINHERIPERGGALIVANHVTYADALFISLTARRPVRFIVAREFMGNRILSSILELFNSLPISNKNPREAINAAAKAIRNGELICIFPEGQLTRTGCLSPIRRGVEVIARRSKAPIIPIYMDRLWGSIFSYHRSRFFTKMPRNFPYPFTAAIGETIDYTDFSAAHIVQTFRKLSAKCLETTDGGGKEAILRSLEIMGERPQLCCGEFSMNALQIEGHLISESIPPQAPKLAQDWIQCLIDIVSERSELYQFWMNACQIRRVNTLREKTYPLLTTIGKDEAHEKVLAVLWPIITHTPVYLIDENCNKLPANIAQIVGSSCMRQILLKHFPATRVPFYDFSGEPDIATPNMKWSPCYASPSGVVISMSMRKSVYALSDGSIQLGTRPRSYGLLLPGHATSADGSIVHSPVFNHSYNLPASLIIDNNGFLLETDSLAKASESSAQVS